MEPQMTFVSRCKAFFGVKEGQGLSSFTNELKALTAKDKTELCKMFNDAGMSTSAPGVTAAKSAAA